MARYRVTAPYVTLTQRFPDGVRLVGLGVNAVVDGDAIPAWQLKHHLDSHLIEAVEDVAPEKASPAPEKATPEKPLEPPTPTEVRAWAQKNDVKVSTSGPISADVMQAYADAHR